MDRGNLYDCRTWYAGSGPARLSPTETRTRLQKCFSEFADVSAEYLIGRMDGALTLSQIFNFASSVVDEICFENYLVAPVFAPSEKRFEQLPEHPIIGFPKGADCPTRKLWERTEMATALRLRFDRVHFFQSRALGGAAGEQGDQGAMSTPSCCRRWPCLSTQGVDAILDSLGHRRCFESAMLSADARSPSIESCAPC